MQTLGNAATKYARGFTRGCVSTHELVPHLCKERPCADTPSSGGLHSGRHPWNPQLAPRRSWGPCLIHSPDPRPLVLCLP